MMNRSGGKDPMRIKAPRAVFKKVAEVGYFELFNSSCRFETSGYGKGWYTKANKKFTRINSLRWQVLLLHCSVSKWLTQLPAR